MRQQVTLYRIHNHSFIREFGPVDGYSFYPNSHREGSDDGPKNWLLPEGYTVRQTSGLLALFGPDGTYEGAYAHGSGILADPRNGLPYIPIGFEGQQLFLDPNCELSSAAPCLR